MEQCVQGLLEPLVPNISTLLPKEINATSSKENVAMDSPSASSPSAVSAAMGSNSTPNKLRLLARLTKVAQKSQEQEPAYLTPQKKTPGAAAMVPPSVSPLIVTPPPACQDAVLVTPLPVSPPVSAKKRLLFTTDHSRKNKRWCREQAAIGQSIAAKAGLDFNRHFQVHHRGHLEKGHWQDFLLSLAGVQVSPCEKCQSLAKAFKLAEQASPEQATPGQPSADSAEHTSAEASQMQVVVDESPSPAHKRARHGRGRPKDMESRLTLTEWVEAHRPGQYRILSLEGKVPVQCTTCGLVFNAHRTSSAWHVLRHETDSKFHLCRIDKTIKTDEPPAVIPCNGVEISKMGGSLGCLVASMVKYIKNGCIHTLGSPLAKVSCFLDKDGLPWMRSKECEDQSHSNSAGQSSCAACNKLARLSDVSKDIATISWKIDAWLHDVD